MSLRPACAHRVSVRESQQSVEGYQQRQEHLKQMASLMKREHWPLPEQQSANMVMCDENVSQTTTTMIRGE